MRAKDTREAQSPKAALAKNGTDDIAAYIDAAITRSGVRFKQIGLWRDNCRQARAEAGFHRKCIEQWRTALGQIEWEPKLDAAVDTGNGTEVAAAMAEHPETKLEMARRHVREGETHVARQREIVAGLPVDDEGARIAERLLVEFERTLRDHKTALARLEKAA